MSDFFRPPRRPEGEATPPEESKPTAAPPRAATPSPLAGTWYDRQVHARLRRLRRDHRVVDTDQICPPRYRWG